MKPQPLTWIDGPPPPEAVATFIALFGVTKCPPREAYGLDGTRGHTGRTHVEARSNVPGRRPDEGVLRTPDGRKRRGEPAEQVNFLAWPIVGWRKRELEATVPRLGSNPDPYWFTTPQFGRPLGRLALAGVITGRQRDAGEQMAEAWHHVTPRHGYPTHAQIQPREGDAGHWNRAAINDDDDDGVSVEDDEPDDDAPDDGALNEAEEGQVDEPNAEFAPSERADRRLLTTAQNSVERDCGSASWRMLQAVVTGFGLIPKCASLPLLRRALDAADGALNPWVCGPGAHVGDGMHSKDRGAAPQPAALPCLSANCCQ